MNGNVVPCRITEAREARAMSMADLADNIGVTRQSISKYEKGIISPSFGTLQLIAKTLEFPIDFFYKSQFQSSTKSSSLFFRSNSNTAKKVKTACKYQIKWTNDVKRQLEEYLDFLEVQIPTIDSNYEDLTMEDVEELALMIRKDWGLSDTPIKDLIGILENRGIIIAQFSTNQLCAFNGIEAFSAWDDGIPYILYHSVQKSAVRTRFSILHELGHLIMHSSISEEDSIRKEVIDLADSQADRFAASFLLPATSFPNDIKGTSINFIEMLKRKWGASMSTIIKRCETLNLLSENQINYLHRQMSTNKYWRKEPLDDILSVEPPELLRDAVFLLIENRIITKDSFLISSGLSTNDLQKICGLPDDFFQEQNQRTKPILKVINFN